MKKSLSILLFCLILSSAAGCGNSDSSASSTTAATAAEQEATTENTDTAEDSSEAISEATQGDEEVRSIVTRPDSDTWDFSDDILTIVPSYNIAVGSAFGTYMADTDEMLCQAGTTSGETIWIYLAAEDFKNTFAPDMNLSTLTFTVSDLIVFDTPKHIEGTWTDVDTLIEGASDSIGQEQVILLGDCTDTDSPVEEVSYTSDLSPLVCAKANITSIEPAYTLSDGRTVGASGVICKAETESGDTIWISMKPDLYQADFDADATFTGTSLDSFEPVVFDSAITVHGVSLDPDSVASGLASATGANSVLHYVKMD